MEAAPVSFTQDPGQHVHFEVQLRRELCADQVGRARALPPCDQPPAVIITTLLRRQCGRVSRERRADAVACRWLVDVQALLGAAGIAPAERPAVGLVMDTDHRIGHLGREGTGAAGELGQDLVDVPLEELALAVQPLLTAVHICG